jgi:copper ion binding protein
MTDTQKELIMSFTETHNVVGMTCDHCVRAVRAEVSTIEGVTDVDVDLAHGVVRVTAEQPVPTTALRDAVEEAGYTLA